MGFMDTYLDTKGDLQEQDAKGTVDIKGREKFNIKVCRKQESKTPY